MFCSNPECPDFLTTGRHPEYREGMERCPRCQELLVEVEPAAADDDVADLEQLRRTTGDLTPVFEASVSEEAEMAQQLLEEAGIRVTVQSAELFKRLRSRRSLAEYRPVEGSFVVLVPEADSELALQTLEELETTTAVGDGEPQAEGEHACVGDASKLRFAAAVVDNMIASVLALLVASKLPFQTGSVMRWIDAAVVYLGYFLVQEGMWQATVGKLMFGLKVVSSTGEPAGWKIAFIRTLLRIVEVNPILFGGLPAAFVIISTPRNQRVGDGLADALVIKAKREQS
jgi:uncharacterized RDD family membrane protein YckC